MGVLPLPSCQDFVGCLPSVIAQHGGEKYMSYCCSCDFKKNLGVLWSCILVVLPGGSIPRHFSWISSGLLGITIHSGTSSRHAFLNLCQQNFTDIFRTYSLLGPGCKQWRGMVTTVLATVNAIVPVLVKILFKEDDCISVKQCWSIERLKSLILLRVLCY